MEIINTFLLRLNFKKSAIFHPRIGAMLFVGFLFFGFYSFSTPLVVTRHYELAPESQLAINGSSNVNKFSCVCGDKDHISSGTFEIQGGINSGQSLRFRKTILNLETESLECSKKGINKDLYDALQSDKHPYISINLIEALPANDSELELGQNWTALKAKARITIAGTSKLVDLPVQAKELRGDKYQFLSQKELLMSDFGIDPPRPFFGLIKVDDQITINLDLRISLA